MKGLLCGVCASPVQRHLNHAVSSDALNVGERVANADLYDFLEFVFRWILRVSNNQYTHYLFHVQHNVC